MVRNMSSVDKLHWFNSLLSPFLGAAGNDRGQNCGSEGDRNCREVGAQEGARAMICDGIEAKSLEESNKVGGRGKWYRAEPRAQWARNTGTFSASCR